MNIDLSIIEWSEENNTGIRLLDDQHRGIVGAINSLQFYIQTKKENYFLYATLSMIDSYTKLHFYTEESLLAAANYQGLEKHKLFHNALIKKSYILAHRSLRVNDPVIYLNFLKDWWINHINKKDSEYVDVVRKYILAQGGDLQKVLL